MRKAAPHAWPNARMIALADEILGCEGRLIAAREAMGPAELTLAGAAGPPAAARLTIADPAQSALTSLCCPRRDASGGQKP